MSVQAKMQKLKLTPLPMPKRPVPIQISLNDNTLAEKIRQVVNEGNVDSITYKDYVNVEYDNALKMRVSHAVVYNREDTDSQFFADDLFVD